MHTESSEMDDMCWLVLFKQLPRLLLIPDSMHALSSILPHYMQTYPPEVCLRRAYEEPLLAIVLPKVTVRGLGVDHVLDALTYETGTASDEDSDRHCCGYIQQRVERDRW